MKTPKNQPTRVVSRTTRDGKDELNLAEWPIAALTDQIPEGVKTLEFQDHFTDSQTNKTIVRKLTITASDKWGLPTATDEEVMVGLIQLSKHDQFINRKVHFNRSELLDILGWAKGGRSYERLQESLQRWVGVTLHYENAWRNHLNGRWVCETFHILDNVSIELFQSEQSKLPTQTAQQEQSLWYFTWNDIVFRSFQAGHLKTLDLDLYRKLKLPTSKRMYRFLDKRLYNRSQLEMDLRVFACEHIGLSRDYSNSKIQQRLENAIEELQAVGFLADARFEQVSRGNWHIHFTKSASSDQSGLEPAATEGDPHQRSQVSQKASHSTPAPITPAPALLASPSLLDSDATKQDALLRALIARGVLARVAQELLSSFEVIRIERCLAAFDQLQATQDPKIAKNPPGYLVESIRKDYHKNDSAEDQSAGKANTSRESMRRQLKEKQQAERQKEREEQAKEVAKREHVARYLESLTDEQRQDLEARAIESCDAKAKARLQRNDSCARLSKALVIEQEVLRVHPFNPKIKG